MQRYQPHRVTPVSDAAVGQKRGRSYNCKKCGLPKKGHVCDLTTNTPAPARSVLPEGCLLEVLKRLPPLDLISSSGVCREWRDTARLLWRRLRVPASDPIRFVGSALQKCVNPAKLSLRMESNVDSTMLASIASVCPNLESLEIFMSGTAVNLVTGEELSLFVAERGRLTSLKVEGCSNLGSLVLVSNCLSKLWLSNLYCASEMVFNCPNLNEISLYFSHQENDSTDLTNMVDWLGKTCPRLQSICISSTRLSHAVALALTAANFRKLRTLSLVLGSEITDASVAAIASSYRKLKSLDLSGSSITDDGIEIICNVFRDTLLELHIARCSEITPCDIQFVTSRLPLLELMDCDMTICDPNLETEADQDVISSAIQDNLNNHQSYEFLYVKHKNLKKLSLRGCCGLGDLFVDCPKLVDLKLNSCRNLEPAGLMLICPGLECVTASGCKDILINSIQSRIVSSFSDMRRSIINAVMNDQPNGPSQEAIRPKRIKKKSKYLRDYMD